jgi:hypothetical protein
MPKLELVIPSEKYLASYLDALTRGWSPDDIRGAEAAGEEILEIAQDPARFIAQRADDREAKGGPVKMPDGSTVERLPGFNRWLWDSEFCGSIGFRWQPGTAELPYPCSWAYRLLRCTVEKGTKIRCQSAWTHVETDASRGTPLCPIGDRFRQYCATEGDPFKRRQANRRIPQACAKRCRSLLSALSHCAFSRIRCGAFSQNIRLNTKHGGFADGASLRNRRQTGRLLGSSRLSVSRGFRWRFHYRQGRISR